MMNRRDTRHRQTGFTLIELMVVLAITGLITVLAVVGYHQGLYREYWLSQQMRSVVNALHVAQWRALQNKANFIIKTGDSTGTPEATWYPQVTFVTTEKHNFVVGDIVAFSNLTAHASLNMGRYYVSSIGPPNDTFTIDWFTEISTQDTDPGSSSTERPTVMNTRSASQLIIMKRSYVNAQNAATQKTLLLDPQNFIYNDNELRIWDANATTLSLAQIDDQTYQITLGFDGRGLPANPAGYRLALGRTPADKVIRKLILVSPTGKIGPGGS